jgi:hypothetical protein
MLRNMSPAPPWAAVMGDSAAGSNATVFSSLYRGCGGAAAGGDVQAAPDRSSGTGQPEAARRRLRS